MRTLVVDGEERRYFIDVPAAAPDGGGPPPLVIALHGSYVAPEPFADVDRLVPVLGPRGWVVVHPEGFRSTWNGGFCCAQALQAGIDDVAFIAAVLDDVAAVAPYDPERVAVGGHSNGAIMAYRVGCEMADRVSAVIAVAGSYQPETCDRSDPVALLHIHGTADDLVPIEGQDAGTSGPQPAVEPGMAAWAAANGCGPWPGPVTVEGPATTTEAPACPADAPVRLITLEGQPHEWPASGADLLTTFLDEAW